MTPWTFHTVRTAKRHGGEPCRRLVEQADWHAATPRTLMTAPSLPLPVLPLHGSLALLAQPYGPHAEACIRVIWTVVSHPSSFSLAARPFVPRNLWSRLHSTSTADRLPLQRCSSCIGLHECAHGPHEPYHGAGRPCIIPSTDQVAQRDSRMLQCPSCRRPFNQLVISQASVLMM